MTEHQTRLDSIMESVCNVLVGLGISMVANALLIPLVTGQPLSVGQNATLGVLYTIVSLVRSYAIRRLFNGRTIWNTLRRNKI